MTDVESRPLNTREWAGRLAEALARTLPQIRLGPVAGEAVCTYCQRKAFGGRRIEHPEVCPHSIVADYRKHREGP